MKNEIYCVTCGDELPRWKKKYCTNKCANLAQNSKQKDAIARKKMRIKLIKEHLGEYQKAKINFESFKHRVDKIV